MSDYPERLIDHYLDHQHEPIHEDEKVLFEGISNDAAQKKGLLPIKPFRIYARHLNQAILGGITGMTFYGCMHVDMLWIKDAFRNHGFGTKLMQEAERVARERKCTFATVNTMDWQALPFYQKLGYQIEFVREGFDKNSKMFLLRKNLISA